MLIFSWNYRGDCSGHQDFNYLNRQWDCPLPVQIQDLYKTIKVGKDVYKDNNI